MSKLLIEGGMTLSGSVSVPGAKNSILPLMAATILTEGKTTFCGCPMLNDVRLACDMLEEAGSRVTILPGGIIEVDSNCKSPSISRELSNGMRGSITFLGPMLAKTGRAVMHQPGGCSIGERPIDIHLEAMRILGAKVQTLDGSIVCTAKDGLVGDTIKLRYPSVGATENIIMAATLARGITTVVGAACEPEISDLALYLNRCGAEIHGAGKSVVRIVGKQSLTGTIHRVIPDRMLAATIIAAGVVTRSDITLNNIISTHMLPVTQVLSLAGINTVMSGNTLRVFPCDEIIPIKRVVCAPHPSFPTDAGPLLAVALSFANGRSEIFDGVFENRFLMARELCKFGAELVESGRLLTIYGSRKRRAADVNALDLRGGAAALCMALACDGLSSISSVSHIDRGYEKIEELLGALGARIRRTDD